MRRFPLILAFGALGCAGFVACSSDDSGANPSAGDGGPATTPDGAPAEGGDGDAGAAAVFFKSGSRIAFETVHVEGEAFAQRFFDKKLGTRCDLMKTSETTAVCVPISAALVYEDASCSKRAALAPSDCSDKTLKYGVDFAFDCGKLKLDSIFVYPLGAPTTSTTFYESTGTTCEGQPTEAGQIVSLGAPLRAGDLVSFTAKSEAVTPELARTRWIGADGSEWVDGSMLHDVKRDAACQGAPIGLEGVGGVPTRCVAPLRAVHRGGGNGDGPFTEATCTTPAANSGLSAACGKPGVALVRTPAPDAGACSAFYFVPHELAAELASPYFKQGASCNLVEPTSSTSNWSIGAEIPASELPALAFEVFGAGRVRTKALASNGVRLTGGTPFDSTTGSTCTVMHIGNSDYCVTASASINQGFYADAACTTPIVVGGTTCYGPKPPAPQAAFAYDDTAPCDYPVKEVHAVTPMPGVTQGYRKNDASCDPEVLDGTAYAIGAVIDPATVFPKATIATE